MLVNQDNIGLVITGIFGVILSVVGGIMARRGARLGKRDVQAPDVQQLWVQQEADRRMRQFAEDLWWNARQAFKTYHRRVTATADTLGLPPEKRRKFELLPAEKRAINAEMPAEPDPSK